MDLNPVYKFISIYSLPNGDENKLIQIENDVIDEYNKITLPYRDILIKIDKLRKEWSIPFKNPEKDLTFVYDQDIIIKLWI